VTNIHIYLFSIDLQSTAQRFLNKVLKAQIFDTFMILKAILN